MAKHTCQSVANFVKLSQLFSLHVLFGYCLQQGGLSTGCTRLECVSESFLTHTCSVLLPGGGEADEDDGVAAGVHA